MDQTHKMLRAVINGQATLKQEIFNKFDKVDKRFDQLDKKVDDVKEELTKRIDKIGLQLAYLEDDAPTREEFDNLEKKVDKLAQKIPSTI